MGDLMRNPWRNSMDCQLCNFGLTDIGKIAQKIYIAFNSQTRQRKAFSKYGCTQNFSSMGANKDITALTGQKHPTCRSHERGNFVAAGNGWLGNERGRKSFMMASCHRLTV